MQRILLLACLALASACAARAQQLCGQADIQGPYGFQLYGTTTIGDGPAPIASIGRLVFDGTGGVSGMASVNFRGYFLGNPVTGSYEFKNDCTFTVQLQDDSGAFQHFRGTAQPGGASAQYLQTDPGAGAHGVLVKTQDGCQAQSWQGTFSFALSGAATQFATTQNLGTVLAAKGTAEADGAGNLALTTAQGKAAGSYTVDSDCITEMEFALPEDPGTHVKLRGILVNAGKEVLAVESDPGRTATAHFTVNAIRK